jgi:hypothetical protein
MSWNVYGGIFILFFNFVIVFLAFMAMDVCPLTSDYIDGNYILGWKPGPFFEAWQYKCDYNKWLYNTMPSGILFTC